MLDGPDVVRRAAERLSASAVVGFDFRDTALVSQGYATRVGLLWPCQMKCICCD